MNRRSYAHSPDEPWRVAPPWGPLILILVGGLSGAGLAPTPAPAESKGIEAPFLAENETAMARMMDAMTIKPSGDVDVDFAAMMIPHHQGAIDMAEAELRHGHNETLHRIAQEIVVEQLQEIAAMRLALNQSLPPSAPAPTTPKSVSATSHPLSSGAMHMAPATMKAKVTQ